MTKDGWRNLVIQAVSDLSYSHDSSGIDLLATHLEECDKAKQALRDKGYGWTGLSILETVNQVPSATQIVS